MNGAVWLLHQPESSSFRMTDSRLDAVYTPTRRPPTSVYSRKKVEKSPAKSTEKVKITEANFTSKMLEALRPSTSLKNLAQGPERDDDQDDTNDTIKRNCSVKNVHELLQVGHSARQVDELEYLLSGVADMLALKKSPSPYLKDISKRLFADRSPIRISSLRASGIVERLVSVLMVGAHDVNYGDFICSYIMVTLYHLCSDIRRMDHFITIKDAIQVALRVSSLDDIGAMSGVEVDCNGRQMALWLLAKLCLTLQTSSQSQIDDSMLSTEVLDLLESGIKEDSSSQGRVLFSSGILSALIIQMPLQEQGSHRLAFLKLVSILTSILKKSPALAEDCLKVLISLTGSNNGADVICSDSQTASNIVEATIRTLSTSPDLLSLCSSLLINLVDRSEAMRCLIKENGEWISVIYDCSKSSSELSCYAGVVLGIIFHQDPTYTSYGIRNDFPSHFQRLLTHLRDSNQLTETIKEQLLTFAKSFDQ